MKKDKSSFKIVLILIMSFISVLALSINPDIQKVKIDSSVYIIRVIDIFYKSLPKFDIIWFLIYIMIFYFFSKSYFKKEKTKVSIVILSLLLSTCLLLGHSFADTNSLEPLFHGGVQIIKSITRLLGYYFILYALIKEFLEVIKRSNKKESTNKVLSFIFDKHPYISITIILLIAWLPFIILTFPGVISWDAVTQIYQLLGRYQSVHINIINPSVTLNNHHPIITTLIYNLFINIGKTIGSVDIGLYLYILCQVAFMIYVINYSFKILSKMNISNNIKLIVLIFYILCPVVYISVVNILKDVLFSIFMFYYVLLLIEMLIDSEVLKQKTYLLKLIIVLFFIMMIRNNGVYTIMLSYPFLLIVIKEYRKQILITLLVPFLIYTGLNNVVYPALEITPGSIKEALSIPFQQTARTLYENKEYDTDDWNKINSVLDANYIKEHYKPTISDPVKNTFNKKSTKDELKEYFKVWGKYLFKYPGTYIEAGLNTTYGYWYPNKSNTVGDFRVRDDFKDENPYNMKYLNTFQDQRDVLEVFYNKLLVKTPVIGTLLSAGFYSWMLLILAVYTFLSKEKKYLIIYAALLSITLVCIASPYFSIRYMLSIVYSMPILICNSIYIYKSKRRVKRKPKTKE